MKLTYLTLMIITIVMLLAAVASILIPIAYIEKGMGSGGAFIVAMAFTGVVISLLLASAFGLLAAALGYVYQDKLPSSNWYRPIWPVLLSIPGILLLVAYVFPAASGGV
jgi:hypothetical protein